MLILLAAMFFTGLFDGRKILQSQEVRLKPVYLTLWVVGVLLCLIGVLDGKNAMLELLVDAMKEWGIQV